RGKAGAGHRGEHASSDSRGSRRAAAKAPGRAGRAQSTSRRAGKEGEIQVVESRHMDSTSSHEGLPLSLRDGVALQDILDADFRGNPSYELVLFDRLPSDQREALKDLTNDPDFYGVLLPREGTGHAIKSVCRDTALLYLTLTEPGPLPSYVRGA